MVLFTLFIEPLFLKLEELLQGFPPEATILGGPRSLNKATEEKEENYVDDAKLVLIDDEEFAIVHIITCSKYFALAQALTLSSIKKQTNCKMCMHYTVQLH